ncbi:hypothetical protein B0T10DRAFT_526305 [Thelonectria olida]|uniref:BZIP domain-containing protein n=1 Tax=Thelonectria olida TaxID=1576542 RepID=A0A9P8WGI3_9HYPO|nr:hypothetical protein B0T10DRAFT_526305 [Thelonectria olida]
MADMSYLIAIGVGESRRTRCSTQKPVAKKVVRRDPEKRRMQNRLAQKTYREKQRKRIEELERRADISSAPATDTDTSLSNGLQVAVRSAPVVPIAKSLGQTVDPTLLQNSSTTASQSTFDDPQDEVSEDQDLLSSNFDTWFTEVASDAPSVPPVIFFNCGCPVLHVPVHPSSILLPVIPDPRMNTLRIDIICSIQALIENCVQVGITRAMFCSEDSMSPFYRPQVDEPEERANLVASVQRGFRGLHFDLRPTKTQIISHHHPFMDALPFKDVRDNLIKHQYEMDEDEFFHDCLNHLTCWGSVKGAHTGSPWDCRSWEASEMFLQKWWVIVGGDDGELTRQSRWWRSLRGERVTEVLE